MTIRFNITEYESNHGAVPRGRGNWAFSFGGRYGRPEWCPKGLSTFTEAKAWAAREAKRGVSEVWVMP